MKIALVIQRYGTEVSGGAELHARWLAERLIKYYNLEVITTTAIDYFTWDSYYKEGTEILNGVPVRRFPSQLHRENLPFLLLQKYVFRFPHPRFMEEMWEKLRGPYSPKMLEFLKESREKYDLFIFYTYLYACAYYGAAVVRDKAILVPTAHDELPIKMRIFRDFFKLFRGFIYLTVEEQAFLEKMFDTGKKPGVVIGSGINVPSDFDAEAAFNDFPQLRGKDYVIFVGRVSVSKGVDYLIKLFTRYLEKTGRELYLVLIGKMEMEKPKHPWIITSGFVSESVKFSMEMEKPMHPWIITGGFVSESVKFSLEKNARAMINPSRFESLSIILLESWLMETPVIVNEECEVMVGQVKRSGGGLTFKDQHSFDLALSYILDNPEEASRMANSGKKYVIENYSWDVIEKKVTDFIDKIISSKGSEVT